MYYCFPIPLASCRNISDNMRNVIYFSNIQSYQSSLLFPKYSEKQSLCLAGGMAGIFYLDMGCAFLTVVLCFNFFPALIFVNRKMSAQIYHNNPKYWDRLALANSVDPDQMPQNVASDQGLQCLPLIQHILETGSKRLFFSNFRTSMVRS